MPITRTITIEKKKTRRTRQVAFKRKPNPKGKHLVVVESPAKAKTIERILGPDYKVMASMGHLRDLPKRTMGVDIENGFTPEYVNSTDRANVIKDLQKAANQCCDILLATDPDREGEARSTVVFPQAACSRSRPALSAKEKRRSVLLSLSSTGRSKPCTRRRKMSPSKRS